MVVSQFYVHTPVETRCQWLLEKYTAKVPLDSPNSELRIKYGAIVETLDHYVRQLLAALDESGHADNTLDRTLYWHFPYYHPERDYSDSLEQIGVNDFAVSKTRPHSALRRGSHKLIYFYEDARTELFDLAPDLSEQENVWTEQSEIAVPLKQDLEAYLDHVNARRPTRRSATPD